MKTTETQAMAELSPAERFFYEHAGCSYDPTKETREEGKVRGARDLAEAERKAAEAGLYARWELDGMTNREWTDKGAEYGTWGCVLFDADGISVASICGVDFGNGGEPWGNPYRRVLEAELASEVL